MLDDETLTRYARQIVIPGIGAAGQEALLAARVLVLGDDRGAAEVTLWLRRAGVGVVRLALDDGPVEADAAFDVAVAADVAALDERSRRRLLGAGSPVCWYCLDGGSFRSGVHPEAPLPAPAAPVPAGAREAHFAAAAEVAGLAAAILAGLPHRRVETRFEP